MTHPVTIGITRCSRLEDYVSSIEQTGARVRVLEVSQSPRALLAQVDGVLLTGGGDVDPVFYGEPRHPATEDAEPGRDEFEIDLAARAIAADRPMLAICRGAQVLNVAAGGSLIQDIPSSTASNTPHAVPHPKELWCHALEVTPGSSLAALLSGLLDSAGRCRVNSRHHQAVARVGSRFVATARAPDGIVEAIEKPDATFCIGVQWHPENFRATGEFRPLFEAFTAAARSRGR